MPVKPGQERVYVFAGTQALKTKAGGKEKSSIVIRPTKRVAEKLNLNAMSDDDIAKFKYTTDKNGRAVQLNGRWRGGLTVIVPDPQSDSKDKDGPPKNLRAKGSKFLRFTVPGSFTLKDIASLLQVGGKAKYFSTGRAFWPIDFAAKLKAKTLTVGKAGSGPRNDGG